ncbi:4a-hydroxytetrahydrobiopterin dehydratase [bacterium]|nr:4a-hydroxytetrahydrobiopterin dehydratase [bacterium]
MDFPQGWEQKGKIISKEFKLATYQKALNFVLAVGSIAEELNHHPDILINYKNVTVNCWTHTTNNVSEKDVELAEEINGIFIFWEELAKATNLRPSIALANEWVFAFERFTNSLEKLALKLQTQTFAVEVEQIVRHTILAVLEDEKWINKVLKKDFSFSLTKKEVLDFKTSDDFKAGFLVVTKEIKQFFTTLPESEIYTQFFSDWGQFYTVEQMFEHAIVHVDRHRRQIDNLIK